MFYWLTEFSDKISFLNVFRYITFRTGGAVVTALIFVFLFGSPIIDLLRLKQGKGQPIRADGPPSHLVSKKGTPTMGGLMILSGLLVSTLLWANPTSPYVWVVLGVTLSFGLIGFYDDYLKVTKQTNAGFAGRTRLAAEALVAVVACVALAHLGKGPIATSLVFPFFKELVFNLGWAFFLLGTFVIVGAGNAVNLTDGLDGLAIVPVMIAAATFGLISYVVGNALFSEYLQLHYVAGTGELAVVCGAVIGGEPRLPLVQRAAGLDLHGRYRLAGARRHARRGGGGDQARDRAGHRRRAVRAGSGVGDRAGGVVQAHGKTRVQDGADPPSLRAARLDRAADRDPVLDRRRGAGARRAGDAEVEIIIDPRHHVRG